MKQTTSAQREDADQQEIRVAVVLNGGVSLAVWISGVVVELNALVQGSRKPADVRAGNVYAELLDVLRAQARVDVIAGTSAGGLNGGFLALGLAHGCDLSEMRTLWQDQGDISALLRDPREKDAPSLLRGTYFHDQLADAYARIFRTRKGHPALEDEHVELYLTGTLWNGRRTPFTDDMGRRIVEVDHDATFHFSTDPRTVGDAKAGNLRHDGVAAQLAVASRCTSSFPGAFEPFRVEVAQENAGDRWPSTAGLANFADSQFVVDGGVLRNKPVRPAIDAVYRQSASRQVRRVLAYVVPDPGEAPAQSGMTTRDGVPRAHEVLLAVLTRMRSTDSVAEELAEIARRNDDSRLRRRTRDRLAQAFLDAGAGQDLAAAAFPAYREVRHESSARTVSRLLLAAPASRRWSAAELTTVLRQIAATDDGLPFVPNGGLEAARSAPPEQWRWGQSAVSRLGDLTLDVLKRAVWLAPMDSAARVDIVRCRDKAHSVLAEIRADRLSLDEFWRDAGERLPKRQGDLAATPDDLVGLRAWLSTALTGWEGSRAGRRREVLHDQARRLAGSLYDSREALRVVVQEAHAAVDPRGEEQARLRALVRVLLEEAHSPDDVLERMLDLEVAQVAFSGASGMVEQEVELVQVSSLTPDLLTGVQEHHFGAFYRASWRVNDWLRGRLDGSVQLVQMLLAPERLRQLPLTVSQILAELRSVAVGPEGGRHHLQLAAEWDAEATALLEELTIIDGDGPLPRTLPRCAARIAARLQAEMVKDELEALAKAVLAEPDPLEVSERWAVQMNEAAANGALPLPALRLLAQGSEIIGRQRIRAELNDGTDTFTRTVTHGAASMTSMVTALGKPKVVSTTLSALRGYAVLVWVLVTHLTTRSHSGRNLLSLVVGVGAALLALTLVVPAVPIGVTLAGVLLLLGATTASALAQHEGLGWRLGVRVGVACLAVLVVLGAVVAGEVAALDSTELRETLVRGVGKGVVVVAVLALGWFLARAEPQAEQRRRNAGRPAAVRRTPVTPPPADRPAPEVIDLTDGSGTAANGRVGSTRSSQRDAPGQGAGPA